MALAKWQPAVNSTFGNTTTTYTSEVEGPMRLKYPGQGKAAPEGELLTSLTEVVLYPNQSITLIRDALLYQFCSFFFLALWSLNVKKVEVKMRNCRIGKVWYP